MMHSCSVNDSIAGQAWRPRGHCTLGQSQNQSYQLAWQEQPVKGQVGWGEVACGPTINSIQLSLRVEAAKVPLSAEPHALGPPALALQLLTTRPAAQPCHRTPSMHEGAVLKTQVRLPAERSWPHHNQSPIQWWHVLRANDRC